MIKRIFSALLVVAFVSTAFAQKQNNQWRFGAGGGIDFNTNPPSFVPGSATVTSEGSASISDKNTGALLFYTDGVTVWNSLNQIMPNGTGLRGGSSSLSSTTAAVIIPKPLSPNLFYIVTIDEQFSPGGVRYSLVDMSLNGGLGAILPAQKNILLLNTTSEKLEVVPAADGQSFWLLTHDEPGSNFYAYKITSAGIQNTPIISSVGSTQANGAGHMKINRQFTKIAIGVTFGSKIDLLDFDNATGVVSNPITWNTNFSSPLIYGIEFSPNGNVLYVSNLERLVQYDISQPTGTAIQNSAYEISFGFYQAASLQLAENNKIYINSGAIDAINCPNQLGALCGFQQNVIAGQSGGGGYGLPKWIYYPDDVVVPTTNSISKIGKCQGLPISFSLQNTTDILSVSWNFGDPTSGIANNTSNSLTPVHTYTAAGTYTVSVVINYDCYTDNLQLEVTIDPTVNPTFNSFPAFCSGATPPELPTTSNNGIAGTWSPEIVSNTTNGSYTFTPNAGQCATNQTATIMVTPNIVPTFNPIPNICAGATPPLLQTTSNEGITGTWSPSIISNTVSGTYTFTPNAGQCITTATIITSVTACASNQILYTGTCHYSATYFSLQNTTDIVSVNWNFGEPLSGVNNFGVGLTPVHQYSAPGSYQVTATVATNTGSYSLSETIVIQPTTLLTFGFPIQYLTGSAVPSLPATSNEGVPGTWSPSAIDPFNSGTYIFTPSVPGCYADNQVYIFIVNCLTPTFTPIIKVCPNTPPPTLPTTSLNGFTGVWSPSVVSNTTSGTYTFIPNPGQNACAGVNMYIEVASGPPTLALTSAPTSLNQTVCINEFIQDITIDLGGAAIGAAAPNLPPGVFGSITGTALTFSGIVLSGANSPYNFTISSTGGNCGNASLSGSITVTPLFIPSFSFPTSLCAGQAAPVLPTTSDNGISGTWSPSIVSNTLNATYTFTPANGQCADVKVITVSVNNSLSTPIFDPIPAFCTGTTAPLLPTNSINGIAGTWMPSIVNNTNSGTYTFTPNAGQCATSTPVQISINVIPAVSPAFNAIPTFCEGSVSPLLPTISTNGITGTWIPATVSNTTSGTYAFTPNPGQCATNQSINITVTPQVTPNFAPIPAFCIGTTAPTLPTNAINGITGTWVPATVSNATSGTYAFTPNPGQCATTQSINVTVNSLVTPNFAPIPAFCEGTTAPILPSTSLNGLVGTWAPSTVSNTSSATYTFTPNAGQCANAYSLSITVIAPVTPTFASIAAFCAGTTAPTLPTTSLNGIAGTWSPALVDNTTTSIYAFTASAGQCASVAPIQMGITVNPLITPTFSSIPAFCAGTPAIALPTTSLNGITGSWSPALVDNTTSASYSFIPNTGQCTSVNPTQISITVNPLVIPVFNAIPGFCAGTTAPVLPSTSLNGIAGSWSPALINTFTSGTYTFTPNPTVGQCSTANTISVAVLPGLAPNFPDLNLCENQQGYVFNNQSPNGIIGTWTPATVNFSAGGSYTFTPNPGQCSQPQTISVTIASSTLTSFVWEVSEPFSSHPYITILPNSPGNYVYQLDNGPLQSSNIFYNVSSGIHTVQVSDAGGCFSTIVKEDILIINYPKYFTPNADGYNDTWNITDLFLQNKSKIYIYDRYGKLLKQIFPFDAGWDGNYNNSQLPSDDYWFTVEFEHKNATRIFKSHFTLKK
jgi:gliding motility-associated-like protein